MVQNADILTALLYKCNNKDHMKNHFIESSMTMNEWDDSAIYTLGNYTHSGSFSFYVGEADVYSKRPFSYSLEVINEFGKNPGSVRVPQIIFRARTVEPKLKEMDISNTNPFNTTDLKRFREIIERMFIDILDIPSKFNKKRIRCSDYELGAALMLYLLSRKEKSILKCLDWISKNIDLLTDFNYPNRKFIIFDEDPDEIVKLKNDINIEISNILGLLYEGKYLQQGGYLCRDTEVIYSDSDILITLCQEHAGLVYIDQLWNSGKGNECVSLYKDLGENKKVLLINPQNNGLAVDFRSWLSSKGINLNQDVLDEIEYELLLPSTL